MTAPTDKTVSLIRKLLALSNDAGATEHEAQRALEKAQQIMAEFNLTMATVEASGQTTGESANRVKDEIVRKAPYSYQKSLMAAVAKLNSVWCEERYRRLAHTRTFEGFNMIGREANVASTRVMFEYLVQAIEHMVKGYVQDPSDYFKREAHHYREGCASRIVERLGEKREEELKRQERDAREAKARNAHPGAAMGNALVVVMRDFYASEDDLNNDMRNGWTPGETKRRRDEAAAKWEAERARRNAAIDAILTANPGINADLARYMADGWSRRLAEEMLGLGEFAKPEKEARPETDRQRQKREEREQRDNDRYWERQYRHNARHNTPAHRAGRADGDKVGLDQQMGHQRKAALK